MMKTVIKLGLAGTAATLLLSACAEGPTLAPAGAFTQGSQTVTLDRAWTAFAQNGQTKTRQLVVDDPQLNSLYVSDGLTPAEPLFIGAKGDTKSDPAPHAKANMSLSEQIEYVGVAVAELGYLKVETKNPKPVTVGDSKGVRFEFTATTAAGLNIHGLAQAVSKKNLNYYIVFISPEEHYYAAYEKNVIAVMDSEKLP